MYGVRFQSVPVHFSFNGSSSQRTVNRRRQISTQPEQSTVPRAIRSPHRSKWCMATDLIILQMVLVRQIHPEKAEVCWQGIADILIQRGYVEAGLPAGAVKSRFFSILHQSMQPNPLNSSKVYDTIAILFHDKPSVPSKQSNLSRHKQPKELILPTDCANSHFTDKSLALRYLDQASLRGHCAQALGIHHSQRPDMVARRRQTESLQSQSSQSTQIIMNSQPVPKKSQFPNQLPTPDASSDGCTVDQTASSSQRKASKSKSGPSKSSSLIPNNPNAIRSSQPSQSSRKRAYSSTSEANPRTQKFPRVKKESDDTVPRLKSHVDMNAVFRAESAAAAKFRADQIQALRERCMKSKSQCGKLYLAAFEPTIPKYKRETCFMRHRLESQILNLDDVGLPVKARSSRKRRRRHRSQMQQLSEPQKPETELERRVKVRETTPGRRKVEKKKSKKAGKTKATYIELPSSPIGSDRVLMMQELSQASSQNSRLGELVQRIKRKEAMKLPVIEGKVMAKSEELKRKKDVVQEIYERVKQNRIDKATKVARSSSEDSKPGAVKT